MITSISLPAKFADRPISGSKLSDSGRVFSKRKTAWRLKKKWFNRFTKHQLIGQTMIARIAEGMEVPLKLTTIKIKKETRHRFSVLYEAKLA